MTSNRDPESDVVIAVMASYSGDINGTYAPSSGTAPLYVSDNCASYCESCSNSMVCSVRIAKSDLQVVTFPVSSAHEMQLHQSQKLPRAGGHTKGLPAALHASHGTHDVPYGP